MSIHEYALLHKGRVFMTYEQLREKLNIFSFLLFLLPNDKGPSVTKVNKNCNIFFIEENICEPLPCAPGC